MRMQIQVLWELLNLLESLNALDFLKNTFGKIIVGGLLLLIVGIF